MRYAYGRPISLPDIAAHANLSLYHFLRIYKRAYGETPHEFLTRLRLVRAKTLLARGSHNVTEACFEVGFSSLGSFSSLFAGRRGFIPFRVQAPRLIGHLRPVLAQAAVRSLVFFDHDVRTCGREKFSRSG